jgi:hypothetical protein
MMFKIDTHVPAPKGRPSKWPFIHMDVGQSVYIKGEDMDGRALRAARQVGFRSGGKKVFVGRPERDGIRIWRTQ